MTEKELAQAKNAFVSGRRQKLRLGGYGGTVRLSAQSGGILIETTKPSRRQRLLPGDSRSVRRLAVEAAEQLLARVQKRPAVRRPSVPPPPRRQAGIVTPRDIWLSYLRRRMGPVPQDVFRWGKREISRHLKSLTPEARALAGSVDHLNSVVQAARRLDRDGAVRLDADIESVQPGDLNRWVQQQLAAGASPHTAETYRDRLRAAVRAYSSEWPQRWGDRTDPTQGVVHISTSRVRPPEVGEERVLPLRRALQRLGHWRAVATAMTIDASARRVGSVSGAREGLHLDAPPLCASDFRRARDGVLWVTWRAAAQKGEAYGRGDVEEPAARELELAYRWCTRYHPNPVGPEHPLIWSEADPTRAEPYDRLRSALDEGWRAAFGTPRPKGLGFHAYCRTTISVLSERLGTLATADFVGRSEAMVRRYRRVHQRTLRKAALELDAAHAERRAQACATRTEGRGPRDTTPGDGEGR